MVDLDRRLHKARAAKNRSQRRRLYEKTFHEHETSLFHNTMTTVSSVMMAKLLIDTIASPIGALLLVADGKSLCALEYADCAQRMRKLLQGRYENIRWQEASDPCGFSSVLRAYFEGEMNAIDHIPINPGGTVFQRQVWSALRTIPSGAVLTYGEMAAKLGRPTAYRAVGTINALNPIAIVVPCHRLVGANGALTGYAGGLERKRWLLEHEGVDLRKIFL